MERKEKDDGRWRIGKAEVMWQKKVVINYNQSVQDLISTLPRNIKVEEMMKDFSSNKKGILTINLGLVKLSLDPNHTVHGMGPTLKEAKIIMSESLIIKSQAGVFGIHYFSLFFHEIPFRNFCVVAVKDQKKRIYHIQFVPSFHCYSRNTARIGEICVDDLPFQNNLYYLVEL